MNFLELLRQREIGGDPAPALQEILENSFLENDAQRVDLTSPTSTSSTIAIAVSSDGVFVATTHGDHTVKVFAYATTKQIRNFVGHPRTPWTVRFHPTNPDVLASACLGYHIKVWSIKDNRCLRSIVTTASVISLTFHPQGDIIGLAAGSSILMWKWKQKEHDLLEMVHSRNVRAVTFHPNGKFVLVAAPSQPRRPTEHVITYSSLFCVPVVELYRERDPTEAIRLQDFPVALPQIHVYSDGGLDLSPCGTVLTTCARLCKLRTARPPALKPRATPFSPMSTSEGVEGADGSDAGDCPPEPLLLPPSSATSPASPGPPLLVRSMSDPNMSSRSPFPFHRPHLPQTSSTALTRKATPALAANTPTPASALPEQPATGATYICHCALKHQSLLPRREFAHTTAIPQYVVSSNPVFGGTFMDGIAVLQLALSAEGMLEGVDVINFKLLPGRLPRAVTSLKLSPTGRYLCVGYGVRVDGIVQDHEVRDVACEVLSIQTHGMPSSMTLRDLDDEVNISIFHPIPGHGVVYGTKRGRTRIFTRVTPI